MREVTRRLVASTNAANSSEDMHSVEPANGSFLRRASAVFVREVFETSDGEIPFLSPSSLLPSFPFFATRTAGTHSGCRIHIPPTPPSRIAFHRSSGQQSLVISKRSGQLSPRQRVSKRSSTSWTRSSSLLGPDFRYTYARISSKKIRQSIGTESQEPARPPTRRWLSS